MSQLCSGRGCLYGGPPPRPLSMSSICPDLASEEKSVHLFGWGVFYCTKFFWLLNHVWKNFTLFERRADFKRSYFAELWYFNSAGFCTILRKKKKLRHFHLCERSCDSGHSCMMLLFYSVIPLCCSLAPRTSSPSSLLLHPVSLCSSPLPPPFSFFHRSLYPPFPTLPKSFPPSGSLELLV